MEESLYCQGCGINIQTENKDQAGFVPRSSLEQDREDLLCRRCFRLKHYNETQEVAITDNDFLQMVSSIRSKDCLVVHIIDLFDVNGSLIPGLSRIVGDNKMILVGNKLDLLPKSLNKTRLHHWLRSSAKEAGLTVDDLFLISSTKGHGMEELLTGIENLRGNKDVYIVGTTNVGKSTFINKIIKQSTGQDRVITTSYFPGTTLGFIEIPLDGGNYLVDTPGIVNRRQISHYVTKKDLKLITPKKEIKARTYQLNSGQTLYIGGLARIDFIKGDKQPFVCYFSNDVPIHRTKLENADSLYKEHIGELLSPPCKESLNILPALTTSTMRIQQSGTDIVIPGLGWVTIVNGEATVTVHSPKEVSPSLRRSFV